MVKALFINCLLLLNLVGFAHAFVMVVTGTSSLVWYGVGLSTAAMTGFFGYLAALKPARTSQNIPILLSATTSGALLTVYGTVQTFPETGMLDGLALFYSLCCGGIGSFLYVFWYSKLDRHHAGLLAVGSPLPDFSLCDEQGEPLAVADFLGRPLLILFYRGNWCPLCMAQVQEVAQQYRELEARGVKTLLVSTQPQADSMALAKRFNVPFRFLVDPKGRASRTLGILHERGLPLGMETMGYGADIVFPTVLVVDTVGTIIFSDQTDNYRLRPEPETFMSVIATLDQPVATTAATGTGNR